MNYETDELIDIALSLKRPQTFLWGRYFSEPRRFQSKQVTVDVEKKGRRLAPFTSPRSRAVIVEKEGFGSSKIRPAHMRYESKFDPEDVIDNRMMGEQLTGELTPEQRLERWVAMTEDNHLEMKDRRMEWMCAQLLISGQVAVVGEGVNQTVSFQRDAQLTETLTGGARWGESGVDPLKDLATRSLLVQQLSGAPITEWVMEADAWDLFTADSRVQNLLDTRRGSEARIESAPVGMAAPAYQGRIGNFDFWTYNDWYVDPSNPGTELQLLPQHQVVGAGPGLQGVTYYGAIQDSEAGFLPLDFFFKTYKNQNPPGDYLMFQSSPLPGPQRPDNSFGLVVR